MTDNNKPLGQSDLQGPAGDFADYCEAEFERRRNSDSPFDEAAYQEARELVLRKLIGPVEEV
ncbi:MAG: nodulation protein E [Pseudomonadota bacterium]|nr:nodulation protein E [Pseudomonadota bacterium]